MGIGGGTFGVTVMTLYGVPIHRAVATAAGFGLVIGLTGAIGMIVLGSIYPVIVLILLSRPRVKAACAAESVAQDEWRE